MTRASAVLSIVLLTTACAAGGSGAREEPTVGDASSRAPLFAVPERQLSQLQLAPVQASAWDTEVHTTATVDWDADHTSQAITQVSGVISRIVADLGREVKAGEPLLYVGSPDLAAAVAAYRKASNRLALAKRTLQRSADLLEHGAIAQKDLEAAQADFNDASTEDQNDLQALRLFGVTAKEIEEAGRQDVPITPELAVRAPVSGTVVQKLVSPGQYIQAGTTICFAISNTTTVWVQGHLRDSELPAVRVGDPAEVRGGAGDRAFHGTVSYLGAMLDPATRTTPVRIVTANREGLLKKDQFVDLVIHTSAPRNVLTVPVSAVLYSGEDLPIVYRQASTGRFARVPVTVGERRGGLVEIVSGLRAGDVVVGEGGLFLQFAQASGQ